MSDSSLMVRASVALFLVLIVVNFEVLAMAEDTLRPEISAWGYTGNAAGGEPFQVWANVSDYESGVRNVSLVVRSDVGNTSVFPLDYNGSLYVATIPPLAADHTYTLNIRAFDMANNSAVSYSYTVDRRPRTTQIVDPNKTAPVVIASSIVLMALVIISACIYDRRHNRAV